MITPKIHGNRTTIFYEILFIKADEPVSSAGGSIFRTFKQHESVEISVSDFTGLDNRFFHIFFNYEQLKRTKIFARHRNISNQDAHNTQIPQIFYHKKGRIN